MRRLLLPALLLLSGCAGFAGTGVPEPGVPGRAVLAHDAQTGELLWRKEIVPPIAATEPVLVDGVVLVHGGPLIAYDARSGERLWSLEEPTLPQVAGDLVILPHDGDVQAIEPRSGRSLWRVPVEPGARVFSGPGGVLVATDRQAGPPYDVLPPPPATPLPELPGAVQLLTTAGRQAWRVQVAAIPISASPGERVVAVAGLRGDVLGLATADGRQLWRSRSSPASVVQVADDRVLARLDSGVAAYDARSGAELWRRSGSDGSGAPLQVAGGRVLVVDPAETSRVLALADGRVLEEVRAWDVELSGDGIVRAEPDELRFESESRGWISTVSTGDRPVLWTDADDDVVVGVAGWGQPATRD